MRPVAFTEHWHEGHDGQPCPDEDCPERCDAHLQTIADLQSQVERLTARGIEDMKHEIVTLAAERDAAVGLAVDARKVLCQIAPAGIARPFAVPLPEALAAEAERQRLQREELVVLQQRLDDAENAPCCAGIRDKASDAEENEMLRGLLREWLRNAQLHGSAFGIEATKRRIKRTREALGDDNAS